jgi:hypothetical protein
MTKHTRCRQPWFICKKLMRWQQQDAANAAVVNKAWHYTTQAGARLAGEQHVQQLGQRRVEQRERVGSEHLQQQQQRAEQRHERPRLDVGHHVRGRGRDVAAARLQSGAGHSLIALHTHYCLSANSSSGFAAEE